MKRISILFIMLFCAAILKAQQLPQITQYMINNYTINPFGRLDIGYGKLEHYTESTGTNALHYESVHLHQKNSALGIHLLRKAIK